MGGWPGAVHSYYDKQKLLFCPAAVKPVVEGAIYPFAAWSDYDDGRRVVASYCANFWVSNESYDGEKFWRTPHVVGAAYVPLLLDGNWKDTEPEPDDQPWATREEMVAFGWEPGDNEMKRVCIDRHGAYVNACFLDFSVRRIGLKQLWRTRWSRQWDMQAPLPNPTWPGGKWPEWMANMKEPVW